MAEREVTLGGLEEVIKSPLQISLSWKNGKAKGIRFSTLEPISKYLKFQPRDILEYVPYKTQIINLTS